MIKAIFFDVDGTLLSHTTKSVPDSTRRCLNQLTEQGIKIFISTGRHISALEKLPINDLSFDGYVTLNGQLVLDSNRQLLFSTPFSPTVTQELVSLFQKKTIPIIMVDEKHIYANYINDLLRQVQRDISSPLPEVAAYDGAPIYQASIYIKQEEEDSLKNQLPSGCKTARWHTGGIDLISENGGKVAGIKQILELYHISQEETMAFGDAENDMDMLAFAKIGVAMGNAVDSVKDIADYVTDHIDRDGIEKALKQFGIL